MYEQDYLNDCIVRLKELKALADRAMAQITDQEMFRTLDGESNSIAFIVKHLSGNMRSRWTDFFTSDGEKPSRNRDGEFESHKEDTRDKLIAAWEEGWNLAFAVISSLKSEDLGRTVTIRSESHTVIQAITRNMLHTASHVGQIVLLAKHFAGPKWQTLSIPRGRSQNV